MAEAVSTPPTPQTLAQESVPAPVAANEVAPAKPSIIFKGAADSFVPGVALLFAGMMAFSMGMTDVFFAEATAWTFVAWGLLFIYNGLMDMSETYEVTDEALIIRNPLRFWAPRRTWDWGRVNRLDVVVKRRDAKPNDVILQVYYTPKGEISMERQDRPYDPALALLIQTHAQLNPADKDTPKDVTKISRAEKATFTWR